MDFYKHIFGPDSLKKIEQSFNTSYGQIIKILKENDPTLALLCFVFNNLVSHISKHLLAK